MPNLSEVAEDPSTVWKPIKIANWYGSEERMVEIASETAVWYSTGLFAVPLRFGYWRAIRRASSKHRPSCVAISILIHRRFSVGL